MTTISKLRGEWIVALSAATLMQSSVAAAAPCCAGGGSLPAMITGDESSQITLTTSQGVVIGDAPAQGIPVFRSAKVQESTQLIKLDAATVLPASWGPGVDRWQAGVSVPLFRHEYWRADSGARSAMALGDIQFGTAYEFLPEWTYSEWKPKGFVFAQLIVPTGRSMYESRAADAIDVTGKGFTTATAGVIFVKRWSAWDAALTALVNHSFERGFDALAGIDPVHIAPFWGASLGLGGGWSRGALRLGLRLQPNYLQARTIESPSSISASSYQLSWDTSLDATYLLNDEWSLNGSYVDQTLVGPAVNASLSRTFALTLLKRWPR